MMSDKDWKRRWPVLKQYGGSQPRSKLRNSIPTSSCRPLANSFPANGIEQDLKPKLFGGRRTCWRTSDELFVDIGTEGYAAHAALLVVDVQMTSWPTVDSSTRLAPT